MMIDDAFNLPVDPVRMEMTGTEHITISNVCSLDDRTSKGKITDKTYRKCIIRKRVNQNKLLPIKFLQKRVNQKLFTKLLTQTNKKIPLMKQSMKNVRLQIIHSSIGRYILAY